ncbi:Para-hydroxybenzoate-polyprenyltransferase Coq2 [Penicillium cosmopolitanum]|uniref:4-hydroxybenzoate polyprenyltransferase, mitochondrial n=1 Tax=Penicillium cosmopolitanum TaxID=1131564 RepID=A0A9X0BA27_9EURO|nr:Para-hydroxybenzoate-polyprenyltransferase Coq2 [Penicillium cosmopolitanum]KAJ5397366.1 Para-hydroxybenzoate-polyprenyltransferase Coq2 [Penicillium cosmopolitanum]
MITALRISAPPHLRPPAAMLSSISGSRLLRRSRVPQCWQAQGYTGGSRNNGALSTFIRTQSLTTTKRIRPSQLQSHRASLQIIPRRNAQVQTSEPETQNANANPATHYIPPQTGLIASLPKSWIPYAELVRLDKPAGTYYLFFPTLFSTLLAAPMATDVTPIHVLGTVALFFSGALIMRGAGCAINDLRDRNLDPHVERTKYRPIARGALSPKKAVLFTGSQLLAGLGVLVSFPTQCIWYGIPSMPLVVAYPLAKRVTHYPQAVLGLAFSWGAMMGFPALGVDLLSNNDALMAAGALYTSCVAWTILYDMIYAHMDIKDDVKAGIKSIALRHDKDTKAILTAGVAAGCGPVFFVGSCGSAILSLGLMIWKVQLKNVRNCWWWFVNGGLLTGGGISLGLLGEYAAQYLGLYNSDKGLSESESTQQ